MNLDIYFVIKKYGNLCNDWEELCVKEKGVLCFDYVGKEWN